MTRKSVLGFAVRRVIVDNVLEVFARSDRLVEIIIHGVSVIRPILHHIVPLFKIPIRLIIIASAILYKQLFGIGAAHVSAYIHLFQMRRKRRLKRFFSIFFIHTVRHVSVDDIIAHLLCVFGIARYDCVVVVLRLKDAFLFFHGFLLVLLGLVHRVSHGLDCRLDIIFGEVPLGNNVLDKIAVLLVIAVNECLRRDFYSRIVLLERLAYRVLILRIGIIAGLDSLLVCLIALYNSIVKLVGFAFSGQPSHNGHLAPHSFLNNVNNTVPRGLVGAIQGLRSVYNALDLTVQILNGNTGKICKVSDEIYPRLSYFFFAIILFDGNTNKLFRRRKKITKQRHILSFNRIPRSQRPNIFEERDRRNRVNVIRKRRCKCRQILFRKRFVFVLISHSIR